MRRSLIAMILGALVIGGVSCKSQAPPPPADCSVIPAAMDRIMADRADDPRVVATMDLAKRELVGLCTRDAWPQVTEKCIAAAKNRAAMDQCRGTLRTEAQQQHLKDVNARLRGAIEEYKAHAPAAHGVNTAGGSGSAAGAGSDAGTGSSTGGTGAGVGTGSTTDTGAGSAAAPGSGAVIVPTEAGSGK